jgi:phage baseplate assembly protein W
MPRYQDIDLSFQKNPITRDIFTLTDAEAVRKSVKHLVLTKFFERRLNPYIGSTVYMQLFENITPYTLANLRRSIIDVINNFEPRAELLSVNINPDIDNNYIEVNISFYIINLPEVYDVKITVERLR